jgi:K+ transporter
MLCSGGIYLSREKSQIISSTSTGSSYHGLFVMMEFKSTVSLCHGLAVTGTIITGILMMVIFHLEEKNLAFMSLLIIFVVIAIWFYCSRSLVTGH